VEEAVQKLLHCVLSSAHTIPLLVPEADTDGVGPENPNIFVELVVDVGEPEICPELKENARSGSLDKLPSSAAPK
jgi:hypothetical protein